MAVELMSAKLVAPFYGSSLYVWTTVLISTIAGLTLGYFSGGLLSRQKNIEKKLAAILSIAAALVFALPYSADALIHITSGFGLIPGICLTSLLLIIPPLLCFGMVGPIIVSLVSTEVATEGTMAGTVYFISTSGGILSTFLFGCYLIPHAGLRFCALATGVSLALLPIIYLALFMASEKASAEPGNGQVKNDQKGDSIKKSGYLFAVIEGAAVMAIELIAARMLAPYFGASLFVWAVVIGFTFTGLAIGYYAGGRLADKYNPLHALQWSLLGASVLLMLMHFTSQQLTMAFVATNFNTASILVSSLIILPPLAMLGMVPTLLIKHLTRQANDAGAVTGKVYAISSVSGIITLILFGFYIIPSFGLTAPSIITGIAVGIIPFTKVISRKKYSSLAFILFVFISWSLKKTVQQSAGIEVPYYSEGLLGQVMVADVLNNDNTPPTTDRILYVNRIGETFINKNTGATQANYLVYVSCIASKLKEGSNALLLGLGGGSIANMLHNDLKLNVDVAELDQRVTDVSREYFSLSSEVHVTVDDARHYLEQTSKKYDLIFFDVFRGDIPPPHVLSLESFKKARSLLNENGMIIVNFYGFLSGDIGKAGRSIYKTLCEAGLKTRILPTTGTEEERNLLLIASAENQDFSTLRTPLYLYGKKADMDTMFVERKIPDLNDAVIFTDDKPVLDLMVLNATNNFRGWFDQHYVNLFWNNGVPLFE